MKPVGGIDERPPQHLVERAVVQPLGQRQPRQRLEQARNRRPQRIGSDGCGGAFGDGTVWHGLRVGPVAGIGDSRTPAAGTGFRDQSNVIVVAWIIEQSRPCPPWPVTPVAELAPAVVVVVAPIVPTTVTDLPTARSDSVPLT